MINDQKSSEDIAGSFRDPSGFLFYRDRAIYRQINISYKENYDLLIKSGLYKHLVENEFLIPHNEVGIEYAKSPNAYKIIKPDIIPHISYPYEWCFSQLKDAALATIKIHKKAFKFGMSLKDCSAYNVQFKKCKPILIDTLSFEKYREGRPWVAYKQFCQHFLAPLSLMAYKDIRLNQLSRIFLDGVPLDLTSSLLPLRTRFMPGLFSHIYLHAKSQQCFAGKDVNLKRHKMSRISFLGLIDSLESAVKRLKWQPRGTEWAEYRKITNYSDEAFRHKKELVTDFLNKIRPKIVWDLGANTGEFSRIAGNKGIKVISFDVDPAAVEKNYLQCVKEGEINILPLVTDLTNPGPCIGWENKERMSLLERGPAEAVFALALIHHLAISNNLPLARIAGFFSKICKSLIIEFVPKDDSQMKKMLLNREDIFGDYTQELFEKEFCKHFTIINSAKIKESARVLYLMNKEEAGA